ncbi:putrescine-ornithine antiporter [Burkholderia stabilis]|uniref:putrescine-ornithine antiporter n=1 Tax=Burkholderia stabilis TaxID=95485 RepID=UPI0008517617|nr:putrescine-ornithine antiporter [Burkholderia stabilis]AOR69638.1 putrescine-ornithine antiporter [Burkholderia stabilis]HDR9488978.1 putrescine-ornithine antiporter [Burkholderia stabilis]HDR9496552.1 putrescine-ornithine antiporter [Burkholderia stabilis]HDR9521237.1 putrescine-ornithine antiporter [Burkholderia stabilis]HDR9528263.1 putrescine-ornithine antiporter [Burkholderia stabilis]
MENAASMSGAAPAAAPKNRMNVWQLTILTAVNMMGSGIILLPSKLAQVGTISLLSWIVTAGGSLALAYAFARCGMLSRKPGGMGGYAEYAFGKAGNYMANYTYGLSLVIANVAIGVTAVGYGTVLFDATLSPLQTGLWTIFLLVLTTVANFGGSRITGRIGAVTVWGVIIPVVVVSLIGWFWFSGATWGAAWNPHNMPFGPAVGGSIAVTLWAFLGLESACANSDAVENPERNVPIAVLGGTVASAIFYIVSTNVIAGIVPNAILAASNAPFGIAFATMFTPTVGTIVTALMVIACIGSLLGWQFTVAQVFKSSADVGYFLPVFAKATRTGTPIVGMVILLVAQVALALMTISPELSSQFQKIVDLAVVTNLVPYVMSMAALITIQKVAKVPPAKALVTNVIAMVATAYSFYALFSSGEQALMLGGLCVFLGWTLFGFVSARFYQMEVDAHVKEPGKSLQA